MCLPKLGNISHWCMCTQVHRLVAAASRFGRHDGVHVQDQQEQLPGGGQEGAKEPPEGGHARW